MKILVPVKRVLDYNLKPRVKSDETGIDLSNLKLSMNPFDEIALEEAVRLKEKGQATEVIIVSIGDKGASDTLRAGLAMGADKAIHILHEDASIELEPLAIAKILKKIFEQEACHYVFCGKQAIDDDYHQTGQMLAGLLDCPQVSCASKVVFTPENLEVTREIDGGLEVVKVTSPAVIMADLRLNTPRYASLPNIMKAKQKPMTQYILSEKQAEWGIDITPRFSVLKVTEPPKRKAGKICENLSEITEVLKG